MAAVTILRGQDAAVAAFLAASERATVHHAWLITGPRGIGKATFARQIAMRLLAEAWRPGDVPKDLRLPSDHPTAKLIFAGAHPDHRELRRLPKKASDGEDGELARRISIDQVRGLGPWLGTKPTMSDRRVVVIDSADDLDRPGASNALLKSLEEPPAGTVFLLVSHAPGHLLPTIRSRCRTLRLEPLGEEDMRAVLADELPKASAEELDALVDAGEGSPGRALSYAGLDVAAIDHALQAIARDGDADNARRVKLARSLSAKSAQARYEAFLDRVPANIVAAAPTRTGEDLKRTLDAYDDARRVAAEGRMPSADASGIVFELASIMATLAAPVPATAKR